jgi:hypothetical protein
MKFFILYINQFSLKQFLNKNNVMKNILEESLKNGYDEYLKLPTAKLDGVNRHAELYENKWCILKGRSFAYPHPHRHYTFLEFVYMCGKKEDLHKRFILA